MANGNGNGNGDGGRGLASARISSMVKFVSSFMPSPGSMLIFLAAFAIYTMHQLYYALPWALWKRMVIDGCMILAVPFYISGFMPVFSDMRDYCQYQKKSLDYDFKKIEKDGYLEVWEDSKYFRYVNPQYFKFIRCFEASDVLHKRNVTNQPKENVTAPKIQESVIEPEGTGNAGIRRRRQ